MTGADAVESSFVDIAINSNAEEMASFRTCTETRNDQTLFGALKIHMPLPLQHCPPLECNLWEYNYFLSTDGKIHKTKNMFRCISQMLC